MDRRRGDMTKERPPAKTVELPDDDEDEDTATDDERGVKRSVVVRKADAGAAVGGPVCQAQKCSADLSVAKRYHRRHKVCAFHAKAPIVVVAGLDQRFCQQCSRFHELWAFDQAKKSCRRRLAGHNERRRKSSTLETDEDSSDQKGGGGSSSENGWGRQAPGVTPKHFQIS